MLPYKNYLQITAADADAAATAADEAEWGSFYEDLQSTRCKDWIPMAAALILVNSAAVDPLYHPSLAKLYGRCHEDVGRKVEPFFSLVTFLAWDRSLPLRP